MAQQQAKQQAMADAGIKQEQPPVAPQQKQKPLTKAPTSGRKPQNRKAAHGGQRVRSNR